MKSSKRRSKQGIAAWLVTWEWAGDYAKPEQKIAAIFDPHWSPERVRQCVELIYVSSQYSISERIAYAKGRSFNPYPAKFTRARGVPWTGQVSCGHNPFLFGRLVDGLVTTGGPNDEEAAVWTERPRPSFDELLPRLGIGQHEPALRAAGEGATTAIRADH